eukprot:353830-Chlamydomonas_euryale.AAC.4
MLECSIQKHERLAHDHTEQVNSHLIASEEWIAELEKTSQHVAAAKDATAAAEERTQELISEKQDMSANESNMREALRTCQQQLEKERSARQAEQNQVKLLTTLLSENEKLLHDAMHALRQAEAAAQHAASIDKLLPNNDHNMITDKAQSHALKEMLQHTDAKPTLSGADCNSLNPPHSVNANSHASEHQSEAKRQRLHVDALSGSLGDASCVRNPDSVITDTNICLEDDNPFPSKTVPELETKAQPHAVAHTNVNASPINMGEQNDDNAAASALHAMAIGAEGLPACPSEECEMNDKDLKLKLQAKKHAETTGPITKADPSDHDMPAIGNEVGAPKAAQQLKEVTAAVLGGIFSALHGSS